MKERNKGKWAINFGLLRCTPLWREVIEETSLPSDPITSADTNSWLRGERAVPEESEEGAAEEGIWIVGGFWKVAAVPLGIMEIFHRAIPDWKVYGNHVGERMPNMCVRTEQWPESCRTDGPKSHRPRGSTHTHTLNSLTQIQTTPVILPQCYTKHSIISHNRNPLLFAHTLHKTSNKELESTHSMVKDNSYRYGASFYSTYAPYLYPKSLSYPNHK